MILFQKSHRAINNWLTITVIILGFYIALLPWLPRIGLIISQQFNPTKGFVYRGSLSTGKVDDSKLKSPPQDNRLIIPSININEPIIEGQSLGVIGNGGTWRRPNSSTPDKGGNTVVVGHRFTYSGISTFYNLDMLKTGERFSVWWNKQEYLYKITAVFEVPATATQIEANTTDSIITLYTCTPIWTATNRLVIKAQLIETDGQQI